MLTPSLFDDNLTARPQAAIASTIRSPYRIQIIGQQTAFHLICAGQRIHDNRWNLPAESRTGFLASIRVASENRYLPACDQLAHKRQLILKLSHSIHKCYRDGASRRDSRLNLGIRAPRGCTGCRVTQLVDVGHAHLFLYVVSNDLGFSTHFGAASLLQVAAKLFAHPVFAIHLPAYVDNPTERQVPGVVRRRGGYFVLPCPVLQSVPLFIEKFAHGLLSTNQFSDNITQHLRSERLHQPPGRTGRPAFAF